MDHFQLGRAAFEARQFAQADIHFNRAEVTTLEEQLVLRELQFNCAKILRPESSWRELQRWAVLFEEKKSPDEVLELLENTQASIPSVQKNFFHEMRATAFFKKGELAQSKTAAIQHVEHLLAKKLSPHLVIAASKYEKWFPQSILFQFVHLQALLLLEDVAKATEQYKKICKTLERRWSKIEDKKEESKGSVLQATAETMKELDSQNGEATILIHKALLQSRLDSSTPLTKEEWKKAAEIIVHESSWSNLKLILEIALHGQDTVLALESYAALKRKPGFSFVKLTKHHPALKEWLLNHAGARPARSIEEEVQPTLSAEDLKLESALAKQEDPKKFPQDNEDSEELRAIELNAIKQLDFHGPGLELLPDLLVAYRTMGFHRVVSWLLEKYKIEDMAGDLRRKVLYFKVIHAVDMHESYLGLALIEEMLGDEQLRIDEYKELKYVQGCLYMGLGRSAEAQKSFQTVTKIDPVYRQTRERMRQLAQD